MAEFDFDPADPDAPDPDDDPENRRVFDEWLAGQTAKREALIQAACRFVEGCNAGPYGLATLPGGERLVAVGTAEEIRTLLDEVAKQRPIDGA